MAFETSDSLNGYCYGAFGLMSKTIVAVNESRLMYIVSSVELGK